MVEENKEYDEYLKKLEANKLKKKDYTCKICGNLRILFLIGSGFFIQSYIYNSSQHMNKNKRIAYVIISLIPQYFGITNLLRSLNQVD